MMIPVSAKWKNFKPLETSLYGCVLCCYMEQEPQGDLVCYIGQNLFTRLYALVFVSVSIMEFVCSRTGEHDATIFLG